MLEESSISVDMVTEVLKWGKESGGENALDIDGLAQTPYLIR
jgi:hypothetical protein